MMETSWDVIKNLVAIISVITAGLTAIFTFWGSFADKSHTIKIQNWFRIKAQILSNTPLRILPQSIVKSLFRSRKALIGASLIITNNIYGAAFAIITVFAIIWTLEGWLNVLKPFYIFTNISTFWFFSVVWMSSFVLGEIEKRKIKIRNIYLQNIFILVHFISDLMTSLVAVLFLLYFIGPINNNLLWKENIHSALGAAIMPLIILGFANEEKYVISGRPVISEEISIQIGAFAFSAGLSILLTIFALWLGTIGNPEEIILPNIQIIAVNMFFDSSTVAVILLTYKYLNIMSATVVSLIAAIAFGASSIYFSLLWSDDQLSLYNVVRILGGLSPKENEFSLGGLFWLAHSTLIPFIIYATILIFSVIFKIVIVITERYARTASGQDVAVIRMIGATFGIIAFIFGSIWKLIS